MQLLSDPAFRITVRNLTKSYGDSLVLDRLSLDLESGRPCCLMAPSGAGKTTLFRILMGLETADSGTIKGLDGLSLSAVFQEDRLLEGYTVLQNIRLVTGRRYSADVLTGLIRQLLPEDSLKKPVSEFSGGMKRRAAILRAILAPADAVLMDEPFTGLDPDTKRRATRMINEYTAGKLLLFSTHSKEDAALLGAEILHLDENGGLCSPGI
ncbi:MAG: ATP-binding cassette domain-containing protein [Sakamotonia sp.]|jgi:NitT/TauT family transport system ATP-binding protein